MEIKNSKKEPLFSAKNIKLLKLPLNMDNPITIYVLGICSALAVTVKLKPAVVLSLSVVFVLAISNVAISVLRKGLPPRIRIIVQLTIIALLVILVDQFLKAFVFEVSKQLSIYVGLIITNCIIMGRMEAFGLQNKPWASFLDGIGNAAGYGVILVIVGFFRELFGSGTLWDYPVIPQFLYNLGYVNNGLMILPPMALIIVGVFIWIQRYKYRDLIDKS